MQINHNIFNTILSKIALNKWKIRVTRLNEEFHSIFRENKNYALGGLYQCCHICIENVYRLFSYKDNAYNFRNLQKHTRSIEPQSIHNNSYIICSRCGRKSIMTWKILGYHLPINY